MKKLKLLIVVAVLAIMSCIFGVACGSPKLSNPLNLYIDDDYKLSWSEVEDARSYVINIVDVNNETEKEYTSRKTYYALAPKLSEGDYEIKVKAIGGEGNMSQSDWSEIQYLHKDYESGCIYTKINNNSEYAITKFGTAKGEIVIEDYYRGKPVTEISKGAFKNAPAITKVTVGNKVRTIGENAFYRARLLESITIPDTVKSIGLGAFQGCRSLKEVRLPNGLEVIDESTFQNCSVLETIEIPSTVTFIGESAFSGCNLLKTITIPESVNALANRVFENCISLETVDLGKNLPAITEYMFSGCIALKNVNFAEDNLIKAISQYAFQNCVALNAITLPAGLESIGMYAFANNTELNNISIPESVKSVGTFAFFGTGAYAKAIENNETFIYIDKWVVRCMDIEIEKLDSTNLRTDTIGIADYTFMTMNNLAEINLPASVKYIGSQAFAQCNLLSKATLPGVVAIDYNAFGFCKRLNNLRFGNNLETIGNYAFYSCTMLRNNQLTATSFIPSSVKRIGQGAFMGSGILSQAENGVYYAGNWVVGYVENANNVLLKADTYGISDFAFANSAVATVVGLENVRVIGRNAFINCANLSTVSLNANIKKIEPYTFAKCSKLYTVVLPSRLEEIGDYAFEYCSSLTEVNMANTRVKTVAQRAFIECINLKTLVLSTTLETVGDYAFYKCSSIKSVSFPDTMVSIGERAFRYSTSLQEVNFGNGLKSIGAAAFANTAVKEVVLPNSLETLSAYAFFKADQVKTIDFGTGIQEIGDYAFYGNASLKGVVFPANIKSIGKYSFMRCTEMSGIIIPATLEEIGAHAFYGCQNATIYTTVAEAQENWHPRYNSHYRSVVWGVVLDETNTYVVSVTVKDKVLENAKSPNAFVSAYREGYKLVGWSLTAGSSTVDYAPEQIVEVDTNTTLYAVYEVAVEEEVTEEVPEVTPEVSQPQA